MDSISKITQSLTTAEDMRNQTKLVMQPYANWEEYLTPAPLSIAILGELVFISSATDFSINKNPPKDGYKYIKYPDSFRACLMQVCNSGWSAFNEAHRSMDNIRLYTDTVLDHMKAAEKNLFQDDEKVEYNIVKIANNCLELSNATEIYFIKVINIIHELLEVCISAKQVNENEKEEIEKTLVETKKKEESSQAAIKCTEEKLNYLKEDLIQANISYEKALNSLPSAGAIFAMDLFGGIAQTITHLANGIIAIVKYAATSKFRDTKSQFRDEECDAVVFDEINTYSKSAEILKCAQNVQEKMNVRGKEDDIDWTNFYDQKNKSTKTDFEEQQFRRIYKDLEKISDCSVKKDAQLLCQKGIQICNQLAQYAPDGNCEKDQSEKIIVGVLDLIQSASGFNSKSKAETKTPTMCPKPRMMSKQEDKSERTSPGRKATENAQFTIEKNQAQLNQTRESYEKCVEKLERKQEELTEIQITIRQCELKKIELNTTIKMLVTGLDAMGRVKEQWEKMVHFFQMVSNIVKHFKTLTNFVSSEKTQFSKDLLYCQAFKALNIASLVHTISGTYTDVSKKYLIDPVGSLTKLMVMYKCKPEFELEYQKLQNCYDEAERGILSLVLKNKEEFDNMSTARLENIDQQLLAIPPPATPEQIKSIEEAVQDGFTDEEEASVTHPVARLVLWIFILLPVSCAMFVILFMLFC